ncbi:hypothetical protein Tco_0272943 [Tanacetum coccineum]
MIDDVPCALIDIVIKDLDLEPKIDAMMRDFLNSSWWKKLSKETGSGILLSGDGSRIPMWVFNDEPEAPEAASQSPGQAPPSSDYVPDQPIPVDASPTALITGYFDCSDPGGGSRGDPEEDPADGGDDDDDEEEEEEESSEDEEEEEEHLAPADSTTLPAIDLVPSAEDTKAFETDESAPTPPSPRLRRARISVRPQTPMAAATEALIVAVAAALPSSSPPPSPLTPLSSPLPQIPSPPLPLPSPPLPLPAPSSPLLLPATDRREDVPEADMPPRKSFVDTMDATPGRPMSREVGYGITDVWDDMVGDMEERKMPPKRTTTPVSNAAIKALVALSVADALAEHEANRSRNGDDNHDSGTGSRRT